MTVLVTGLGRGDVRACLGTFAAKLQLLDAVVVLGGEAGFFGIPNCFFHHFARGRIDDISGLSVACTWLACQSTAWWGNDLLIRFR